MSHPIQNLIGTALRAVTRPPEERQPQSTAQLHSQFETLEDPILVGMLDASQRFCDEIKSGLYPRWLSLLGKQGTGKSHLAREIYAWVDRKGCFTTTEGRGGATANVARSTRFIRWRKFAASILSGDWSDLEDAISRWFLVIDDIGAEHATPVVKSALERLLDERLRKWTVLTSNLYHRELAEIDARIASRMIRDGSVVYEIRGVKDFNTRK